jgi:transcriptional regulator with PAS, ATPase and Fis domain
MEKQAWFKEFPGAITVTDKEGIILEMNEKSAQMYKADGGYALLNQSAITCHKEPTLSKVRRIYDTEQPNIYSVTQNGKKEIIYQSPYFIEGAFAGFVEICLEVPANMPHFDRDKE